MPLFSVRVEIIKTKTFEVESAIVNNAIFWTPYQGMVGGFYLNLMTMVSLSF
jgi:hypothetical protein